MLISAGFRFENLIVNHAQRSLDLYSTWRLANRVAEICGHEGTHSPHCN